MQRHRVAVRVVPALCPGRGPGLTESGSTLWASPMVHRVAASIRPLCGLPRWKCCLDADSHTLWTSPMVHRMVASIRSLCGLPRWRYCQDTDGICCGLPWRRIALFGWLLCRLLPISAKSYVGGLRRCYGKQKIPKLSFQDFCGADGTRTRDPMRDRHVF